MARAHKYLDHNGIIEAQISRRAELLRSKANGQASSADARSHARCFATLEKRVPGPGADFDLAQITTAVACSYQDWRYPLDGWRDVAPGLAAWFDVASRRPSLRATEPAETPQA